MSETAAARPPFPPEPPPEVQFQRMMTRTVQQAVAANDNGSPATQASANGSMGISFAIVTVFVGVLAKFNITIDATMAAALNVIVAAILHAIAIRFVYGPKVPPTN